MSWRALSRRRSGQLVSAILWLMLISVVGAQDDYQGYRFAPGPAGDSYRPGNTPYGDFAYPGPGAGWDEHGTALTGPGGRPYRFRDGVQSAEPSRQPVFRPDTRLGQQPKNWSADPDWASDPVLRQGLVFRPLEEKESSGKRKDRGGRSAEPGVPPLHPYGGGLGPGGYPAYPGPGFPGVFAPLDPFSPYAGDWLPAW